MQSGELDYEWIERELMDQELSARYAAQRDDSEPELDEMDGPEPPSDLEEEKDERVENTLLESRHDAQRTQEPVATEKLSRPEISPGKFEYHVSKQAKIQEENAFERCFERSPLIRGKQVTITLSQGSQVYCAAEKTELKPKSNLPLESERIVLVDSRTIMKVEEEIDMKISVERRVKEVAEARGITMSKKSLSASALSANAKLPLVQRFKPSRFVDLLSHEKRNRDALRWLRSWDNLENGMVPFQRILLLAGPPGSGKTTLAHVLAAHAGYRSVEVNASDERNSAGLKEKLKSATEMRAVLDVKGRTNLVILDEIDGIADGVQAVVEFVSANKKPLICTCNDAYAPALRQLRRVAFVINVGQPGRPRLVKRLKEICALENVDQRPGALELLALRMDNDLRASLNALDFWIRSSDSTNDERKLPNLPKVLDVEAVRRLPAFAKDGAADLWSTWKQILAPSTSSSDKRSQHRQSSLPLGESKASVMTRSVNDVALVMDGVHENYLRCRFTDTGFKKTLRAAEWFCFVDVVQSRIAREMDFTFQSYSIVGCVGVGTALGNASPPTKLMFPLAASVFRMTKTRNEDALREFFSNPETNGLGRRHFADESLPLLLRLLIPKVRPVPIQAMNMSEREEMDRATDLMTRYGLYWMHEERYGDMSAIQSQALLASWCLDPAVDRLAQFKQFTPSTGNEPFISTDVAKLVNSRLKRKDKERSGETKAHRILQREKPTVSATNEEPKSVTSEKAKRPKVASSNVETVTSTVGTVVQQIPAGMKRDFFGRLVVASKKSLPEPSKTGDQTAIQRSDFVYRFNEGLTDAVRRVVKIQDLL